MDLHSSSSQVGEASLLDRSGTDRFWRSRKEAEVELNGNRSYISALGAQSTKSASFPPFI